MDSRQFLKISLNNQLDLIKENLDNNICILSTETVIVETLKKEVRDKITAKSKLF